MPVQTLRVKVEINTREHFFVLGRHTLPVSVDNPWFSGRADVCTYRIEELLATKLRALYQRKKGRDLFDLWLALTSLALDEDALVNCFDHYMNTGATRVSRAEFEANVALKLASPAFREDILPLLPPDSTYDVAQAAETVSRRLVARLQGSPWQGSAATV